MKNGIITIVLTLLLAGNSYAQQGNEGSAFGKKTRTTEHAMVKGSSKEVVFGRIPVLETSHAMEGNVTINFKGQNYYYNDGDYFMYNGGRYLLVSPPEDLSLSTLPKDRDQVSEETFYSKGIFYHKMGAWYKVIKAPQGAIIYALPSQMDVVTVDDEAYYEYLGVLYEKVFVSGEQAFEVVGELTE